MNVPTAIGIAVITGAVIIISIDGIKAALNLFH